MNDFEAKAQTLLRSSEQHIAPDDLQALRDIRSEALAQPLKRKLPAFLAPAVSMAAASLVAIALLLPGYLGHSDKAATQETADLYEDLDFYSWLANESGNL